MCIHGSQNSEILDRIDFAGLVFFELSRIINYIKGACDVMGFWTKLDQLIVFHEIIIDRPKGSAHPRFPAMIYPLDYGYLKGTKSGDGNEIDIWRGNLKDNYLVGIVCTVDIKKMDTELKLLIGCTENEIDTIDRFHNQDKYMSGIVIRRDSQQ